METKTTNQVRQILMNELGLTRKSIRDETEVIVRDAVNHRLDGLIKDGDLERMVISATLKELKGSAWGLDEIRKMVGEAARKKASEEFDRMYPKPD